MKAKMKRLTALILAMCMAMSLLSVSVWAEETDVAPVEAETTVVEPVEEEAEVEEAPVEVEETEEAPVETEEVVEAPVEETPVEEAPVEEAEPEIAPLDAENAAVLPVDKLSTYTLDEEGVVWVKLVLNKDTNVLIYSDAAFDTYGTLYNEDMDDIAEDDDSYGSLQFSIEMNLRAGTYYLRARAISGEEHANEKISLMLKSLCSKHSFVTEVVAATCTEWSYSWKHCTVCGYEDSDARRYIDRPLGHDMKVKGDKKVCNRCKYTLPVYTNSPALKLGDTTLTVNEKETALRLTATQRTTYTIETSGNTGYVIGRIIRADLLDKADCEWYDVDCVKNISSSGGVETTTFTTDGAGSYYVIFASDEDYAQTIKVHIEAQTRCSAAGHKFAFVKKVAPTCSEFGYDLMRCTICGYEGKTNENDKKLPHKFVAVEGEDKQVCSVCNQERYVHNAVVNAELKNGKNEFKTVAGVNEYVYRYVPKQEGKLIVNGKVDIQDSYWSMDIYDQYDNGYYGDEDSTIQVGAPYYIHIYVNMESEDSVPANCKMTLDVEMHTKHVFEDYKSEPSCEYDGYTGKSCKVCGYYDEGSEKIIPAVGHSMKKMSGSNDLHCEKCDYVLPASSGALKVGSKKTTVKGYTCDEENGTYTNYPVTYTFTPSVSGEYEISVDDFDIYRSFDVNVFDSTYHRVSRFTYYTDDADSEYVFDIVNMTAGKTYYVVLDNHSKVDCTYSIFVRGGKCDAHQFGETVVIEKPECQYEGYGYKECKKCFKRERSVIPALGHKCTLNKQLKRYECSECDFIFYSNADKLELGSKYAEGDGANAYMSFTPATSGTYRFNYEYDDADLMVFDDTFKRVEDQRTTEDRNFYDAILTAGKTYYIAFRGYKDDDWLCVVKLGSTDPCANGHTVVADKAVAATCTKTGKTAGSHCSVCKKVLVAQKTVAKTAHTFDAKKKKVVAPTYAAAGYTLNVCSKCGAKVKSNVKAKLTVSKVAISSAKNAKGKKMTVKWKKNTKVTGYQVQYSTDKSFKKGAKTVTVKKNGTTSTTISKLAKGKTYYVRVRGYKTVSKKNYYSAWSAVKSAAIKK